MQKNKQEMFHVKQNLFKDLGVDVSRETIARLTAYEGLLIKWQKTINLVSGSTLDEVWERHFLDSAALLRYMPKNAKSVYDIGSGAGFPGMVLSIMDPNREYTLIESDQRKCSFLRNVSRETMPDITIINKRIEELELPAPDVITARALSSLKGLMDLIAPIYDKSHTSCMFIKGAKWEQEVKEAQKSYSFTIGVHGSGDKGGVILCINDIQECE